MDRIFVRFFEGDVDMRLFIVALAPTIVFAWAIAQLVRRLAAAALRAVVGGSLTSASPLVRAPLRLITVTVFLLVMGIAIVPAFEMAGLHPRAGLHLHTVVDWAFRSGLRVVLVALVAHALIRITGLLVARFQHEMDMGTGLDALERAKRTQTLGALVQNVTTVLIAAVALLIILTQFEINITPVLTGAGIIGLAVGFGAQTLVRDIITGFFLIFENQVRVGDVAAINGTGGLVEAINLRTIVLRDLEGIVHVFPNGAINTLANLSKDFSYYVIGVGISYDEDPQRVGEVLQRIGASMQEDPRYAPSILAPLEILGVDGFDDSSVLLKLRIKTAPLKQWEVGRELRRRILAGFKSSGIEIPFPQRVVHMRSGSPALQ